MPKIFGREPALWAALAAAVIQGAGLVFNWSHTQQGAINAVAAVTLGVIVSVMVHDGIGAAVLGAVQAVLNLVLAFGLQIDQTTQAAVMGLAAAIVAMFIRTQVTARVTAAAKPIPRRL